MSLSNRINKFIKKQQTKGQKFTEDIYPIIGEAVGRKYAGPVGGWAGRETGKMPQPQKKLVAGIIDTLGKQLKLRSEEEARQYGIKLPSEESKKPKDIIEPKKIVKPKQTISKPKKPTTKMPEKKKEAGALEEIGRFVSPKGRATSPQDIVSDVKESQRLAGKVKGLFKPKE